MSTRFYIPGASDPAASISPAFDGAWDLTSSAIRRWAELEKNSPNGNGRMQITAGVNSPAGASDWLFVQAISPPLDSNQTITGTVKGQTSFSESNAAADMRSQIVIWVYTGSGSRGTLLAVDAAALSHEFAVFGTMGNRQIPRGGAISLSSVSALTGDRVIIEMGLRKGENATTSRNGFMVIGNSNDGSADYPEDETDTNQSKAAWVEFSQTLTFTGPTMRESQLVAELLSQGSPVVRESQLVVELLRPVTAPVLNTVDVTFID